MKKMTRVLSLLLLICLLFGLMPASQAATKAGLQLVPAKSGSQWTVTVKLTGGKKPNMIEFCLEYDSSRLKLKTVKAGSVFSSSNAPTYSTPKTGRVLFAWEALTGLKDGSLLVLTFTAKSGASGTADVWFNEDYNTILMDADMKDIAVTMKDAEIDLDDDDDDWDDDDDDPYEPYVPRATAEPYDPYVPYDPDDDWEDDWDDDWDDPYDPYAEPTPIPVGTPDPYETPAPGEEEPGYVMQDMTIEVGDLCRTQEGFLFLSSDNKVVTIENGQLRGVGPGIATVTAYQSGSAIGSCTITVVESSAQKTASSGTNVLAIVLWVGIALIVAAIGAIAFILIRRRYY